jgi:transcriptional regulator with XRE-family HTH domain
MAHTPALIDTLKRELRARKITYAAVAKHLGLSEITVKRMFSKREISLGRLDRICGLAKIEFSDLARTFSSEQSVVTELTPAQEKEFVANHKLMLMALCVLNRWNVEDILARYQLTAAECVKLLVRLDQLRFIELLPKNRYRLLVSDAFGWIPGGPIQQLFRQSAPDFLRSRFDRENELLLVTSGTLSPPSTSVLKARLRKLASDFAAMRSDDAVLPGDQRLPITMMFGLRPWEPEFLHILRRAKPK